MTLRRYFESLSLSGDVGEKKSFLISGSRRRRLQTITVVLPATQTGLELVIEHARFFFRNPEIWLEVVTLDEHLEDVDRWEALTSAGDLRPNQILSMNEPFSQKTLYLAVVGRNTSNDETRLYPCDGWTIDFTIRQRPD
jgi:hypothetical protein